MRAGAAGRAGSPESGVPGTVLASGSGHAVVDEFVGLRHFLYGELHPGQLGLPARLEARHRVEHHVVELLGSGPVKGHARWHKPAAEPAPVPVPPPNLRSPSGPVLAAVHSHRAYLRHGSAG